MSVRLDRFQLSVVDSPQNASLCVAACPGSGKSTTLACRARKLLADGVPPAQLIVLTFSTKSRDALARRLAEVGCPSSIAVSTLLFGLQTTVGASGATFLVPASPPSRATGS